MLEIIKSGGTGVLLTDTLYGIVGQALNKKVVSEIYKIKGRRPDKPFIILISSIKDLELFGINIDSQMKKILKKYWPGPVSIILSCKLKKFEYLHRGTNSLAFRLPKKKSLLEVIKITGPLVAPSANPEGLPPANNITEAMAYFGNKIDTYMSGGKPNKKPSSIILINNNSIKVIRK